jgi:hypothetical protein
MPATPGETIVTYHRGPDRHGRYGYTLEWWQVGGLHFDTRGRLTDATEGPKGQCFFADPIPHIAALRARAERVTEIDARPDAR